MRNMRQGPMLILLGIFVLFLLFSVLRRPGSTGLNSTDRGNLAFEIQKRIDDGEKAFAAAHGGKYTRQLGDLTKSDARLDKILAIGADIQLSASTDGSSYTSSIITSEVTLVRVRTGDKVVDSCLDNHTGSGVTCDASTDLSKLISDEKKAQQQQQKK